MATRWWVSDADGQVFGPFEGEELKQKLDRGELRIDQPACIEGGETWQSVGDALRASGIAVAPAAPMGAPGAPGMSPPPMGMAPGTYGGADLPKLDFVLPVLTTLCCCLIGGIVAIIYTAQGNTAAATGDVAGYQKAANARKTWMIVSLVIGLLVNGGYMGLTIFAGIAGASGGGGFNP
ncbi:MAG: CD225/dispanin family protein [Phycisphaerales bacterium]